MTFDELPSAVEKLDGRLSRIEETLGRLLEVIGDKSELHEFISRAQVCELLHITPQTLHQWVRQGKIVSYKIGTRTLFKPSEVMAAVKAVEVKVGKNKNI